MSEDDKPRGKPVVKAKLPAAKNIGRSEFTPHGINSKRGGGYRPSGMTAAQAKRRRRATAAAVLVAILAVAGGTTYLVTRPDPPIEATGAFGKQPKVEIPAKAPLPTSLKVTPTIVGKGAKVKTGDSAFVKFIFYKRAKDASDQRGEKSTNEKLGSTYEQGNEAVPMVVGKSGIKGIDKGLAGQAAGSRLILEIPPGDGFGKDGNQQLNVSATDSLVFVVDVLAVFPKGAAASGTEQKLTDTSLPKVEKPKKAGEAPKVTVPKVDAPEKLQVKTLIEGTGAPIAKGQTLVANYQGQIWKSGKTFDSSWERGQPATFEIGTGKVVKGWDAGLVGKKAGSRVMLVIPPGDGYGKEGNPQAGISGTDTLVFVIDILGTLPG
jgi:peptidylprolyl isomerase